MCFFVEAQSFIKGCYIFFVVTGYKVAMEKIPVLRFVTMYEQTKTLQGLANYLLAILTESLVRVYLLITQLVIQGERVYGLRVTICMLQR